MNIILTIIVRPYYKYTIECGIIEIVKLSSTLNISSSNTDPSIYPELMENTFLQKFFLIDYLHAICQ